MEAQFTHLEVLVMSMAFNMVAHVKPMAPALNDSLAQGFDLGFFYGVGFSRPLNEIELSIPNDYVSWVVGGKTLVRVLTTTPITRASA
jgi:hypothetical protein